MRKIKYANNATTSLASNITALSTTINVTPGTGSKFPSISGSEFFMATMVSAAGLIEVVKVTARSGDTFTVQRAAEVVGGAQTAYAFLAGDRFEMRWTAKGVGDELDRLDAAALPSVLNKTADYTVLEADIHSLLRVDTGTGNRVITLPTISSLTDDFDVLITKVTNDANTVTIAPGGTDVINGTTSLVLNGQWQSAWLICDRSTNTWTAINSSMGSGGGSGTITPDSFTGDGTTTNFTLSANPGSLYNLHVTIDAAFQVPGDAYTWPGGTALQFTAAPPAGSKIFVWQQPASTVITSDIPSVAGQAGKVLGNDGSNKIWVSVGGGSSLVYNIADSTYGAVSGGPDCGPALRAAVAACAAAGGGTVYIPPGVWWMKTADLSYETAKDEFCIANLGSNMRLEMAPGCEFRIDGATLAATSPFNAGKRFNGVGVKRGTSNVDIVGGVFTTGSWVLDIAFRSVNAVLTMGDYVRIRGVRCYNMPGRNMIVSGAVYALEANPTFETRPVGLRITDCHFINGAKNVPGNTASDDCSFIYVHGDDIKITGCSFVNIADAVINCGGIELHSSTSIVEGCFFNHCYPAIYTGWQDTTSAGARKTTSTGNVIIGNTFVNNKGGVFLVSPHENLLISTNSFYRCWAPDFAVIGTTRLDVSGVSSGPQAGVVITGNGFSEIQGLKSAIRVAGFQNSRISANEFNGMAEAINLLLASDALTSDVAIAGNTFANPPTSGYTYNTGFIAIGGYDGPSWSGTYRGIIVEDNTCSAASNIEANLAVLATAGNASYTGYDACRSRRNNVRNLYAGAYGTRATAWRIEGVWLPNPQATIWYQDTGFPSVGNGTLQAIYMIIGNTCLVNFSLQAGSSTVFGATTSTYKFKLPIPAAAGYFMNGIPVQLRDQSANLTYTAWGAILAGGDNIQLAINAQGVHATSPMAWSSSDAIETSFSYAIAP